MSNDEYDTKRKVEETEYGYRATITSTRGTGTRDQDKVQVELRQEVRPINSELESLERDVKSIMARRRKHNHPEEDDDD